MIRKISGILLVIMLLPAIARATPCTIFYTWLTGDTLTAARLNGNNTNFQTCGNAIDNTNIGTAGIFASQLKPTTVGQATFGGAQVYTFTIGLVVQSNVDANVPLFVAGNSVTQSGDLGDFYNFAHGTLVYAIGPTGNSTQTGAEIFSAPGGTLTTQVGITNDNNAGIKGLELNVPTSSVNGVSVTVNGANPGTVVGEYTMAGAAIGSGQKHFFKIFGSFNAGSCNAFSTCPNTQTVTLTGVTFTSATSYDCYANSEAEQSGLHPFYVPVSGSSGKIAFNNYTNGTLSGAGITQSSLFCDGT